jgi:hypothetical protein
MTDVIVKGGWCATEPNDNRQYHLIIASVEVDNNRIIRSVTVRYDDLPDVHREDEPGKRENKRLLPGEETFQRDYLAGKATVQTDVFIGDVPFSPKDIMKGAKVWLLNEQNKNPSQE